MNEPRETIKEVFELQISRARYAFNQGMYPLCRVLLAGAEKMAENLEELNKQTLIKEGTAMKHTKEYFTEQMPFSIQPTSIRGEVILFRPEFYGERAINFQMPSKLATVIYSRVNALEARNPEGIKELIEATSAYFNCAEGGCSDCRQRLQSALEKVKA